MRPSIGITTYTVREPLRVYTKTQTNYPHAVFHAGGAPLLLPTMADTSAAAEMVARLDALILSGGEDVNPLVYGEDPHPRLGPTDLLRDRWEIALVEAAEARGIPILGICRGIQLLNVARGGTLYQDVPAQEQRAMGHHPADMPMESLHHTISIEPDTLLRSIFAVDTLSVNSFHHQAVRELGGDLSITARAGDGIIEAVEDPSRPFLLAVQFHAEALPAVDPYYLRLFEALVRAA